MLENANNTLHVALPKGRMYQGVVDLLSDAGIRLQHGSRGYRPTLSLEGVEAKLLKPQNIVEMLATGTRDVGFAGADWVAEKQLELIEILDTGLDFVRIVVAAPQSMLSKFTGGIPSESPIGGPLRIAGEFERLSKSWIQKNQPNARFVRTYGATEVFPPEDADVIVDVTQTGATLAANGLQIIDEIMVSSTRLYASPQAMNNVEKRKRIEDLSTLLNSVLEGRRRVVVEVNVPTEASLNSIVEALPAMRRPTVARLYGEDGYAVKAAVPRKELPLLIPELKARGGADIVVSPLSQVVP